MATFLQASLRPSSLTSYKSVWRQWTSWCQQRGLGHNTPSLKLLLEYLWDLYAEGKVYSSLGVHRSALVTISQPADVHTIGAHPLVSRFMKAVFLSKPPARLSIRPTWDVAAVLDYLQS